LKIVIGYLNDADNLSYPRFCEGAICSFYYYEKLYYIYSFPMRIAIFIKPG